MSSGRDVYRYASFSETHAIDSAGFFSNYLEFINLHLQYNKTLKTSLIIMMSLRSARTTAPTAQRLLKAPTIGRALSTQTSQAVDKLKAVFEHYRQEKYVPIPPLRFSHHLAVFHLYTIIDTLHLLSLSSASLTALYQPLQLHSGDPARFKKDIIRVAGPEGIAVSGLQRVLHNIGADNCLTQHEMQSIFAEKGNAKGEIDAQKLDQLI